MRAILNAILAFIGAESLTDEEFAYCETQMQNTSNDVQTYTTLDAVLAARESVSSKRERLRFYFLAKGSDVPEISTARSNILVGGSL